MVVRLSAVFGLWALSTGVMLAAGGCGAASAGDLLGPGDGSDGGIVAGLIDDGADPNLPTDTQDPNDDTTDLDGGQDAGDDGGSDDDPNAVVVRFRVSPSEGPRPLVVTCSAESTGALPEGVYRWLIDGVADSGPRDTHAGRAVTLETGGSHEIRLSYAPSATSLFSTCTHADGGGEAATVVVWPRISGALRDPDGEPIAGVVVQAGDGAASCETDADGLFALDVPMGWSGRISPETDDYDFDRADRSFTRVNGDIPGQDFVGLARWVTVAGVVTDTAGDPVADLEVRAVPDGGTTTTDASGVYELRVPNLWSGEIAPMPADYGFEPPRRTYAFVEAAASGHDFVATPWPSDGSFTSDHALMMLKSLPSYSGGPRIQIMKNYGYWGEINGGRPILAELVRIGGTYQANISRIHTGGADGTYLRIARDFAQQGVPIWLEMGSIGGLGFCESIGSFDPNCFHACPRPLDEYLNPEHPIAGRRKSRRLFCPCRHACQRQIARWFKAGEDLRASGMSADMLEGVWVHDESAYVAVTSEWHVSFAMYEECTACGSREAHNEHLAKLQANIVHAMMRGLGAAPAGDLNRDFVFDAEDQALFQQAMVDQHPMGDFDNNGIVDADDWTYVESVEPTTPKMLSQFWWCGGYLDYTADGLPARPSPWLPIEDFPGVPRQTHFNFARYGSDDDCVDDLAMTIDAINNTFGKPVVPHLSLTLDSTAGCECGVPYSANYGKAKIAAQKGCPMILCYALNPLMADWMTPELYRKQFESVRAIVEGARDGALMQP